MPCCGALAVRQGPCQRGSRVAYLEWIGEVKRAKRLGKREARAPPPSCPRPTDVSATPPRRRPLRPRPRAPTRKGVVALPPTPGHGASSMPAHQPHGGVRSGPTGKSSCDNDHGGEGPGGARLGTAVLPRGKTPRWAATPLPG